MTWTDKQRKLFLRASNMAGWNGSQRYIAMSHAGCPIDRSIGRPSVKHAGNTNAMFAQVMELAEAMSIDTVPPPRDYDSWADAARRKLDARRDFARQIVAEAVTRMPGKYGTSNGQPIARDAAIEKILAASVKHVTGNDSVELTPIKPQTLDECDTGQLYRVIESLKAWFGREMLAAGIEPESFKVPASARRRAAS